MWHGAPRGSGRAEREMQMKKSPLRLLGLMVGYGLLLQVAACGTTFSEAEVEQLAVDAQGVMASLAGTLTTNAVYFFLDNALLRLIY